MVTLKTQSELHTSHSSSEYVVLTAIFVLAVYGLFSGSLTNEFTGAQVATADLDVAGPINTSTIVSTAQRVGVDKGTIAFRFTPTWNMVDGLRHGFFQSGSDTWANDANRITIVKWDSNNNLYFRRMGDGVNQFNDLILAPTDSVLGTGKTVQEFFKPGQAVDVAWTWYKDPDDGNKPKMNVSLNNYFVKNQTYTVTQPRFVEIIHTFGIGHNGPQWPGTLSGTLTNIKLSTETKIPASNLGIPGGTPSNPPQTFPVQSLQEILFTGEPNFAPTQIVSKGNLGTLNDWTINFDMWSDAVENYRNPFDANFIASGNNQGPRFEQYNDGTFKLVIGKGTGTPLSALTYGTITASRWYHITALKQGNTIQIYLDGIKKAEETNTRYTTTFTNVLFGKGYSNSPERWFKGKIKNFKLENQAVTPTPLPTIPSSDLDVAGPINTSTIVSTAQRVGVDKGTIAFRFTPTWNMVDGLRHGFFQSGSDTWANDANRITIVKWDSNNNLYFRRMGDGVNQFNDLILAPTDSVLGTGKTVQEFFKPGQAVDVAWTWYKDPDDGNKPKMNVSLNNYFVKNQTYTVTQPRFVEIIHTFGIGHNGPQWPGTLSGTLTNIKLSTETKIPASNLGIPGGTPSNPQQAKSGPMTVTISNPTPSTILSRGTSIVTATVSGLSASQNTTIFWAVGGGETFGTITPTTSSGSPATFTAPTVTTRTIVTLLATPTSDTSKSAITTVTIDPTPQVIQPTLGIPRNGNSTSS